MAVAHADRICALQENLASEEMPPPWMWPFDDEMDAWVERVLDDRKERSGGKRGHGGDPPAVPGPGVRNEALDELLGRDKART